MSLGRVVGPVSEVGGRSLGIHKEELKRQRVTINEMLFATGVLRLLEGQSFLLVEDTTHRLCLHKRDTEPVVTVDGRPSVPETGDTPADTGKGDTVVVLGGGDTGRPPEEDE